jgi:hypothetical protein
LEALAVIRRQKENVDRVAHQVLARLDRLERDGLMLHQALISLLHHQVPAFLVDMPEAVASVRAVKQLAARFLFASLAEQEADFYSLFCNFLMFSQGTLRIFVEVPIHREDFTFNLYQLNHAIFSTKSNETAGKHTFQIVPPNSLIAESKDKKFFYIMDKADLLEPSCRHLNGIWICPGKSLSHSHLEQNCLRNLLHKDYAKIGRNCPIFLRQNYPSIFQIDHNNFLLHEPKETDLNIECWKSEFGIPTRRKSYKVTGLTHVKLPNHCRGYTYFNSFATHGTLTVAKTLHFQNMSLDLLGKSYSNVELDKALSKLHNSTEELLNLDKIMKQNQVEEHWTHENWVKHGFLSGITLVTFCSIFFGIILLYCLIKKCTSHRLEIWTQMSK